MNEKMRHEVLSRIKDFEMMKPDLDLIIREKRMPSEMAIVCSDAKKAVARLKRKMESEEWIYLPFDLSEFDRLSDLYSNLRYEHPLNLFDLVDRIVRTLGNHSYTDFTIYVRILVVYEMKYGFWSPSKSGASDISEETEQKIKKITSVARDELNHIVTLSERMKSQIQSVSESEKKASAMSAAASAKVAEITMMLDQLSAQRKGLEELRESILVKMNDADNKNAQLAAFVTKYQEDGDRLLKELNQKTKQVNDQVDEVGTLVSSANSKVEELNQKSEDGLKDVEKNLDETKKNVEQVKKLMGFIADGALGKSFNQRQEKTKGKALFWLWTSLILFVAAIVWIVIVFTVFDPPTKIVWANIVINAIKSSLAVFAFGYALNEYGKERNLQEEYAFKESIALTLNTYLNRLDTCEKDEMKKLLADTVEKLYTKPVISNKEYKLMRMEPKEIAEMLKPIADVVKPLAGKE